jgi:Tol biopolymer transport system component
MYAARALRAGADLFVRDNASPSAIERNVTGEITQGAGDVRDVEPSFDGTKIVFALHEPLIEGADPEDQPTWNIWEYDAETQVLRRVIPSDLVAEEGDDIMPHYLPDGASCSRRRASGSRARSCSTKASRSSRRRTRTDRSPRTCCTS